MLHGAFCCYLYILHPPPHPHPAPVLFQALQGNNNKKKRLKSEQTTKGTYLTSVIEREKKKKMTVIQKPIQIVTQQLGGLISHLTVVALISSEFRLHMCQIHTLSLLMFTQSNDYQLRGIECAAKANRHIFTRLLFCHCSASLDEKSCFCCCCCCFVVFSAEKKSACHASSALTYSVHAPCNNSTCA